MCFTLPGLPATHGGPNPTGGLGGGPTSKREAQLGVWQPPNHHPPLSGAGGEMPSNPGEVDILNGYTLVAAPTRK